MVRATLVAVAAAAVLAVIVATGSGSPRHARALAAAAPAVASSRRARPSRPSRPVAHHPVANQHAVDRVLGYTSYVRLAGSAKREVALTFDDGPSVYTPKVLRVLTRMHAPATFFVIGREASAYPKFIAAEARGGFAVADHTESHPFMAALSPAAQDAQIADAGSAIRHAGAPYPQLWRPPYGSFDTATLQTLHRLRMLMVLWSVDTSDYARPGVSRIIYTAVSGARPGAIILMHDGGGDRAQTVAALPRIIIRLRQRHFKLVTVTQLVADDPPPRGQPTPSPLSGIG